MKCLDGVLKKYFCEIGDISVKWKLICNFNKEACQTTWNMPLLLVNRNETWNIQREPLRQMTNISVLSLTPCSSRRQQVQLSLFNMCAVKETILYFQSSFLTAAGLMKRAEDLDWFEIRYKWPKVRRLFIWKLGMRTLTGGPIFPDFKADLSRVFPFPTAGQGKRRPWGREGDGDWDATRARACASMVNTIITQPLSSLGSCGLTRKIRKTL